MSVVSLTPRALYEEVAELLRQRIFSRELAPGSWIDELRLAEEYGISRTPLREALKVLAAEGLITMKVRRGAYVTEVSEADLRDIYHLLGLLEGDAAAAVARHATPEQLDTLDALHAQLEAAKSEPHTDSFFQLNVQFHATLLRIADNRWREQVVNDLRKVMRLARISSLHKTGRVDASLQEHADVLAALRRRDPDAAMACMRRHFDSGFTAAL